MFSNNNRKTTLLAALIVLAMYNVVVFVIPFGRGAGFWTGYALSMLAMLLAAVVYFRVFQQPDLRSKVYGWPLLSVVWWHLIFQVILGLAQMTLSTFFPSFPIQYGLALGVILLGFCLLGLIVRESAIAEIEHIDVKIKEKTFFIKSLQVDLESLAGRVSDEGLKKAVKALAEAVRYSDPMSNPQLAAIENSIGAKATELERKTDGADTGAAQALCDEMQRLLADRNRKCKMLK